MLVEISACVACAEAYKFCKVAERYILRVFLFNECRHFICQDIHISAHIPGADLGAAEHADIMDSHFLDRDIFVEAAAHCAFFRHHTVALAKRIVDRICTIGSQRIEDAMGFQQVNLYELGTTDPNPCNSTRMITFAFAGIVAAVMMYVFFLIIFLLDDRIKADDENLERYLGLSVLGNIPNADGKKAGKYGYYKTYAAYKAPAKQEVEDK